jgi:hypothetical protein
LKVVQVIRHDRKSGVKAKRASGGPKVVGSSLVEVARQLRVHLGPDVDHLFVVRYYDEALEASLQLLHSPLTPPVAVTVRK